MAICQNSTRENKRVTNKAKKAVSKAMRKMAEEALTELKNCTNGCLG